MNEQLLARGKESRDRLWTIVLAAGEGVRFGQLARRACGEDRSRGSYARGGSLGVRGFFL